MTSQAPTPPQAPAPKNHSNWLWVIAAIVVVIIAIVGVFMLGAKVGNQAGVQQVAAAQESAKPADPPAQADKAAPEAPAAPAQPDKAALAAPAAPAQAASADCSVKPSTKEGFTKCHDDRLLDLERRYIQRGPGGVPTDDSLIAWMKAAGFNFNSASFDARQVEEENIETPAGTVTVVAGIQLTVQGATVKWPALFSTDRQVDATGARSYKPSRNNPSVLYTDVSHPFTGTLTFWADAQNWDQLSPK